jgi:glycogen operon protein
MRYPPVLWSIETSEVLADTKIVTEAWDAAGLYQVGYFPGFRFAEWNGRYRDDVRRFVKGDGGMIGAIASRLGGSADIYEHDGHLPINSVNFVTAHDGFTLNDLVSYDQKHNEANGEENRDGVDDNLSWNCGVEGETGDSEIEALRERQIRNFAAILLLSQGVPMLVAGDEFRRTQRGNNNAYCQDNELSWVDWRLLERHRDLQRFFKLMIAFRKRHPTIHRSRFLGEERNARGLDDVAWHGERLFEPGWGDPERRHLALTLGGVDGDDDLKILLNMDWRPHVFALLPVAGRRWHRVVDTARPSPSDILVEGEEEPVGGESYEAQARSVVVLMSRGL